MRSMVMRDGRYSAVLAAAFGVTVAMWGVGYVGRLPAVMAPSPLLLICFLIAGVAGGLLLGRRGDVRPVDGFLAGGLSGLINLLILGSLLSGDQPNRFVPSAVVWVLGSIGASALLTGIGLVAGRALFGGTAGRDVAPVPVADARPSGMTSATAWFARIAVVATTFLLALGGLVTSAEAGLAVVDWPNSFGYNMFLYPLSRMTGGIYYEHAHRLFGALVGLTTLTLAILLQCNDPRRWMRRLGWIGFVMVCVQGILGGLRVTGRFTMSQSIDEVAPSTLLALVHGVFGQMFFALLVAIAVFTSPGWIEPRRRLSLASTRLDSGLGLLLLVSLLAQLTLGASQRHFQAWVMAHIAVGVLVVTPLAIALGLRGWLQRDGVTVLQRSGLALIVGVSAQIVLGVMAFVATGARGMTEGSFGLNMIFATMHQWFGAVLLGLSMALVCWNARLLNPSEKERPLVSTEATASVATPSRTRA